MGLKEAWKRQVRRSQEHSERHVNSVDPGAPFMRLTRSNVWLVSDGNLVVNHREPGELLAIPSVRYFPLDDVRAVNMIPGRLTPTGSIQNLLVVSSVSSGDVKYALPATFNAPMKAAQFVQAFNRYLRTRG